MTTISTYSQYSRLRDRSLDLQERLMTLSEQVNTGKKGTVFGDLGKDARTSISLRNHISEVNSYGNNIKLARLRSDSSIETMERISDLGKQINADLLKLRSQADADPKLIRDSAKAAYDELVTLLNTRVDGRYIFSGTDGDNPPFPKAQADAFFQAVGDAVRDTGGGGASSMLQDPAAALAATRAAAAGPIFSANLEDPTITVSPLRARVSQDLDVKVGVLASGGIRSADIGPTDELPFMRELLRGFAVAANAMEPSTPAEGDAMTSFIGQIQTKLNSALTDLDRTAGELGIDHARLVKISDQHKDVEIVLTKGLDKAENVNMEAAIIQLKAVETQLQASYKITASVQQISLLNFL